MSPPVRRTDPARRTPAPVNQPKIGFVGWLRWAWRQLTSMRTALLLLLLLALGAVPGSLWPQRSLDASRTADYIDAHPRTGPWLDRLGFFDVYASPGFTTEGGRSFLARGLSPLPEAARIPREAEEAELADTLEAARTALSDATRVRTDAETAEKAAD